MIESMIMDGVKYYNIWGGWIKEDRIQFTDDGCVIVLLNPDYEIRLGGNV